MGSGFVVSGYHIDPKGALTTLMGSPSPVNGYPAFIALDPLRRFMYVTGDTSKSIVAYRIKSQGGANARSRFTVPNGGLYETPIFRSSRPPGSVPLY
jgi:6-phosphogluconolactonase (cycloisomerase 2 family)